MEKNRNVLNQAERKDRRRHDTAHKHTHTHIYIYIFMYALHLFQCLKLAYKRTRPKGQKRETQPGKRLNKKVGRDMTRRQQTYT
jgi:hypothetical protein